MCLIIDINTLSKVFNKNDSEHQEFRPVLLWIINGKGKAVYGGKKYIKELGGTRYRSLFTQLRIAQKAVLIDNKEVDKQMNRINRLLNHRKFDDSHIVAIVNASGCRLVCTNDTRSERYLMDKDLYEKPIKPPLIYKRKKQARTLLTDRYIAECCQPCNKLNCSQREKFKL